MRIGGSVEAVSRVDRGLGAAPAPPWMGPPRRGLPGRGAGGGLFL